MINQLDEVDVEQHNYYFENLIIDKFKSVIQSEACVALPQFFHNGGQNNIDAALIISLLSNVTYSTAQQILNTNEGIHYFFNVMTKEIIQLYKDEPPTQVKLSEFPREIRPVLH
ncbi:hypothetical protein [Colwellia sp. MEBiC06753]